MSDHRHRLSRCLALVTRVAAIAACLAVPAGVRAQHDERPPVPKDADPNDWEAYYDNGIKLLYRREIDAADAQLAWASHLRPDRAEPLYARWIAFWARDVARFERYLNDDEKTLSDPLVLKAGALRERALERNPFVHQGMIFFLYDLLPGGLRDDPASRAWRALAQPDLPKALDMFGGLIARDPKRYGYLRFERASAFINTRRADSASAEISALLAQLRAEDAKSLGNGYQSKELLEYSLGLIHLQAGRTAAARDALLKSLVENAAFAPAHAMLGEIALGARDGETALMEYGLATETDSTDVESILGHGRALRYAKRTTDAVAQFRRAVALEPVYAAPYFLLASALEESGDKAGAADAYAKFLTHATELDPRRFEVQQKIQALTGSP